MSTGCPRGYHWIKMRTATSRVRRTSFRDTVKHEVDPNNREGTEDTVGARPRGLGL